MGLAVVSTAKSKLEWIPSAPLIATATDARIVQVMGKLTF